MSVREANQNFSRLIGLVKKGETISIRKRGKTVATVAPAALDRTQDPAWRAAYSRIVERFQAPPMEGEPIGRVTAGDKYGDRAG